MIAYSKTVKRMLRQWITEAYERELHRELTKLEASFKEWREGAISSGELSYRIHQYERGASREWYKKYNSRMDDLVGILSEDEVPVELREALARPIEMFRQMKERGQLREPDECDRL